jgi:hypothetical protein
MSPHVPRSRPRPRSTAPPLRTRPRRGHGDRSDQDDNSSATIKARREKTHTYCSRPIRAWHHAVDRETTHPCTTIRCNFLQILKIFIPRSQSRMYDRIANTSSSIFRFWKLAHEFVHISAQLPLQHSRRRAREAPGTIAEQISAILAGGDLQNTGAAPRASSIAHLPARSPALGSPPGNHEAPGRYPGPLSLGLPRWCRRRSRPSIAPPIPADREAERWLSRGHGRSRTRRPRTSLAPDRCRGPSPAQALSGTSARAVPRCRCRAARPL